jgi:imidazolonepropionase-like amidohydrolase
MQAIQAGTSLNSELLGWEERLGSIEAGKLADVIAVPGDPLRDLSELEKVTFVMLDGNVIRNGPP